MLIVDWSVSFSNKLDSPTHLAHCNVLYISIGTPKYAQYVCNWNLPFFLAFQTPLIIKIYVEYWFQFKIFLSMKISESLSLFFLCSGWIIFGHVHCQQAVSLFQDQRKSYESVMWLIINGTKDTCIFSFLTVDKLTQLLFWEYPCQYYLYYFMILNIMSRTVFWCAQQWIQ